MVTAAHHRQRRPPAVAGCFSGTLTPIACTRESYLRANHLSHRFAGIKEFRPSFRLVRRLGNRPVSGKRRARRVDVPSHSRFAAGLSTKRVSPEVVLRPARTALAPEAGATFNEAMRAPYDEIADWYEHEFLGPQDARAADPLGISHCLRALLGAGSGPCLEIACGTGVHAATVAGLG